MFVLLRHWKFTRNATLIGGLAFTFGSFNLMHFVHPNAVAVIAHVPWLLWGLDLLVTKSANSAGRHDLAEFGHNDAGHVNSVDRFVTWRRRFAFTAVALLTASQLLLGYPQYVLYTALLEFGYLMWSAHNKHKPKRATAAAVGLWLAAIGIGALVGGIQLLPTWDALQNSVRYAPSGELAVYGSLHPLNLLQLVEPYLFATRVVGQNTHELAGYLGAVPLALAVWLLFLEWRKRRYRRLTLAAIATAVFALIWAIGSGTPWAWVEAKLPVAGSFRFPCRAMVVFQFAFAVLAAIGFGELISQCVRAANHKSSVFGSSMRAHHSIEAIGDATRYLWLLPAASVALALVAIVDWPDYLAAWPLVAVGPMLMFAAVGLIALTVRGRQWALPALAVFAAIDLGIYGIGYSVFDRAQTLEQFVQQTDAPPMGATIESAKMFAPRVAIDLAHSGDTAPGETGIRAGNRILLACFARVDGYAGLEPARKLDYRQSAALRAAGVDWISAAARSTIFNSAANDLSPEQNWYPLAKPQPMVHMVSQVLPSEQAAVDIAKISLSDTALVDPSLPPPQLGGGVPGKAELIAQQPGSLSALCDAPSAQLLVVAQSFHSGWHALVDGQPAAVLRVNGDFIGVSSPPGRHEIRLVFQPESLRFGRLATIFGLGLLVAVLLGLPEYAPINAFARE
jgi:hypothetical protein